MATLVWRRGLKGPTMAVVGNNHLDEYDRRTKMTTVLIPAEHENLSFDELRKLYPPPQDPIYANPTMDTKLA